MDNLMKHLIIVWVFILAAMSAHSQTWEDEIVGNSNAVTHAYTSDGRYHIYAAVGTTLYVSKDKGESESFTPLQIPNSGVIVTAHSLGDYVVIGCDGDGVYISSNKGSSWDKVDGVSVSGTDVTLSSLITSNYIFVGSGQDNQGVIRLSKSGSFENRNLIHETKILCLAQQANYIFAGVNRTGAETGKSTLYRSSDNGETWAPLTNTIRQNIPITALSVSGDQSIIYAASGQDDNGQNPRDGYLYKSTDFGSTWSQVPISGLDPSRNAFYSVAAGYGKDTVLIGRVGVQGSGSSQVWRSINGGTTWSPLDNRFNADQTKVKSLLITNPYYFACRDQFWKYINFPKPQIPPGNGGIFSVCSDRDASLEIVTIDNQLNDTYAWYRINGDQKDFLKNGKTLFKTEMNCTGKNTTCNYRCIVTNSKGLQDFADYAITFYEKPKITLQDTSNKTNVCADKVYEYGITPTNTTYKFQWSVVGGEQVGLIVGDPTKETVKVRWVKNGKLTVKEIADDGSNNVALCEDTKEINIKVRDVKPNITHASIVKKGAKKEITICEGVSLQFQTLHRVNNQYTWFLDGSDVKLPSKHEYIFTESSPKKYELRIKESNGECSEEDTVYITVNKLPDTTIQGNMTLCRTNLSGKYTANQKDAVYVWSVTEGKIQGDTNKQSVNVVWNDNSKNPVLRLLIESKEKCQQEGEWNITITDSLKPQSPNIVKGDAKFKLDTKLILDTLYVCENNPVILEIKEAQGEFEWSKKGDISSVKGKQYTCQNEGIYTLTLKDGNCSGRYSFVVKNTNLIKPELEQQDDVIKIKTPQQNNLTYQWLDADKKDIDGETRDTFSPKEDGQYYVRISDGICTKISDALPFTRPKKFEIVFEQNFDEKFCYGDEIKVTVLPKNNNRKTVNYKCNEAVVKENTDGIFVFDPKKFTNNELTISIIGSISDKDKDTVTKTLRIIDFRSNEIEGSQSVCINTTNDYSIKTNQNANSYLWRVEPSDAGTIDNSQSKNVKVTWNKNGALLCEQKYDRCTFADTIKVTVGDNFEVPIKGETLLCSNRPLITLRIDGSFNFVEWKRENSTLGNQNSIDINEAGIYKVTVSSTNGCKGTGVITVGKLQIPVLKRDGDYLICENSSDYDEIVWLKNTQEITKDSKFKPEDEDLYSCRGTKGGCEERKDITFTRKYVDARLSANQAIPGQKIVLSYTLPDEGFGTTKGTVQWNKNVLNFTGSRGMKVTNLDLVVDTLLFEIEGGNKKAEIEYEVLIGPDTSTTITTNFDPAVNTEILTLNVSSCEVTGQKRLVAWKNDQKTENLYIVPNPANESFTVLSSKNTLVKGNIFIVNSMGETVFKSTTTGDGDNMINTQNLLPGFYTIELFTGTEILHSTVIIHK